VTDLGVSGTSRTDGICRTEVGDEVGRFYGYVSDGIFHSQAEIDNYTNAKGEHVDQPGAQPGVVKYVDVDNNGIINSSDQDYLGSGIAKIHYGFNGRVEWKGFDLSISLYGASKFKAVDYVDMTLQGSYGALNKSVGMLNAWTTENPNTDVPRVSYTLPPDSPISNDFFSQRFIQNASYLKINNIVLGYNLPDKWFGGFIRSARVYAQAQNVTTFTKYNGYNVDFAGGIFTPGYNYASYPTPRTIMFGANFSF
jgi:hypothetical protein